MKPRILTFGQYSAHVLAWAIATQIGADRFKPGDRVYRSKGAGVFLGYSRIWAWDHAGLKDEPIAMRRARVRWDGLKYPRDESDYLLAVEPVVIFNKRFPRLKARHYPPLAPGRHCADGAPWWPE